jgi:hypothetical protein
VLGLWLLLLLLYMRLLGGGGEEVSHCSWLAATQIKFFSATPHNTAGVKIDIYKYRSHPAKQKTIFMRGVIKKVRYQYIAVSPNADT